MSSSPYDLSAPRPSREYAADRRIDRLEKRLADFEKVNEDLCELLRHIITKGLDSVEGKTNEP